MVSKRELKEQIKFRLLLAKAGGFDIEHLMDRRPHSYVIRLSNDGNYSTEILLYAKMGIHRYNMTHGKNLEFSCVKKFNVRHTPRSSAYYITLVAKNGASLLLFQTQVVENGYDMRLSCEIARPKFRPRGQPLRQESVDDSYQGDVTLPKWPSSGDDAFEDKSRYYVVKKSDRKKHDWIRMYMELAFLRTDTKIEKPKLSRLAFVKVAVESPKKVERPKERLVARNATFYIKYKYRLSKDLVEPPLYGVAIVRRIMNKTGDLTLMFNGYLI